jgi:hypothetical protein
MTTGDDPLEFNHFNTTAAAEKIDYRECVRKTVDGNWQCLLCFRQTQKPNNIIRHVETHNYSCNLCGRCFSGRKAGFALKRHLVACKGGKYSKKAKLTCQYCEKTFKFKSRKSRHMLTCLKRHYK